MTTTRVKPVLSALLVAAAFTGATFAHEHETAADAHANGKEHRHDLRHARREARMLDRVDTNEDGIIDEAEFMADAQRRFEFLDANSDGQVTEQERKQAGEEMRKRHREAMKAAREAYLERKG